MYIEPGRPGNTKLVHSGCGVWKQDCEDDSR